MSSLFSSLEKFVDGLLPSRLDDGSSEATESAVQIATAVVLVEVIRAWPT